MRKEVTQNEIDSVVNHLRIHKRVRESSGNHVVADCPDCGSKAKLYANTDSGLWDCKKCGVNGNIFKLATILNVRVRQNRLIESPLSVLASSFSASAEKVRAAPVVNAKGVTKTYVESIVESALSGDERFSEPMAYIRKRGFDDVTIRNFCLTPWMLKPDKEHPKEIGIGIPYLVEGKIPLMKIRNFKSGKSRRFQRTKGSTSRLFNGEQVRNCKSIILCEAELDACSIWQLGHTNVAGTSLGAKKELPAEWLHQISAAEDIVLWYDNDEAGQKAITGLLTQLGLERCRVASLEAAEGLLERFSGIKDANDILTLDVSDEQKKKWVDAIIEKAKPIDQDDVVQIEVLKDSVLPDSVLAQPLGIPIGLEPINNLLKGWRPGEVTIITGHSGHGKTTLASFLAESVAKTHPVLLTSFENGPTDLARKIFQREYQKPISSIKTEEDLEAARESLSVSLANPNLFVANVKGRQDKDKFFAMVKWAVKRIGVKIVLVDHMHYFQRKAHAQGAEHIEDLSQDLHGLADELQVHLIVNCHVNANVDETKIPSGGNLKGGSSVKQECDNGITVFRHSDFSGNSDSKSLKIKDGAGRLIKVDLRPNQSLIYVWKARHVEAIQGTAVVNFNPRTLNYSEEKLIDDAPQKEVESDWNEPDEFDFE